jgi:hypothetical protein
MQPAVLSRFTALEQLKLCHCHLLAYPDRVSAFEGFGLMGQEGFGLGSGGLKPQARVARCMLVLSIASADHVVRKLRKGARAG